MAYFVGLIMLGTAIGYETKPAYGFMVVGTGLIAAAILEYLNNGPKKG